MKKLISGNKRVQLMVFLERFLNQIKTCPELLNLQQIFLVALLPDAATIVKKVIL